jgi:hypothetical protein
VAAYLLLLFFVLALFTAPDRTARITLFRLHLIFGGAVLLLGSPVFIAFAQSAHYYTRGAGITLDRAQFSPFTPQSAISFILPFATTKDMAFYKTDVSMSNAYFGLTGLIFLLASCTLPRSRKQWLIFALALGCMLVSFGPYLPFRKWLYNYVPLMNMFRFPSIFRLFFLVGFITLAAGAFGKVLAERERYLPRIKVITALLLALFLGILAWQRYKNNFYFDHYLFLHDINKFIEQSQHYQHIVLQSAIQIVVLLAFLLLASLRKGRYFTAPAILLLCMADLFMAAQLNARRTVVSANPAPEMYRVVKDMPAGLPVPDNTMNIAGINDNSYPGMRPMILNLNIFQKRVATDGYDPFLLKTYDSLTRSVIRDSVWANPYMYFADRMVCRSLQDSALTTHNTLAVNAADYARLKDQTFEHHPNDKIEVTSFGPGYAMANTHTEGIALLTLQQADYPGWQVTIDEGAAHYFTSNYCNMTVVVPKGDHRVAFRFRPPYITAAALVSLLTLAGIAVALILFRKKAFGSP